jgi:hypothetical protein
MKVKENKILNNDYYNSLITRIGSSLEEGRRQAYIAVNEILLKTYFGWIGEQVESGQKGEGNSN